MKYYIIVFYLFTNSTFATAQKSAIQLQVDAMEASSNFVESAMRCKKLLTNSKLLSADEKLTVQTCLIHQYQNLHNWDTCLQFCKAQIEMARQEKNTLAEATFYKNMGNTYYHIPKKDLARLYWEKCISISKPNHHDVLTEMTYHNIGSVITEQGKFFGEAESYFLKAIEIGKTIKGDNENNMNLHYRLLATIYTQQNKLEKAERIYIQLVDRSRTIKDTARLVEALIFYADVFYKRRDNIKALQISDEALSITRKKDVLDMLPLALALHAKILFAQQKYKEAYIIKEELEKYVRERFSVDLNTKIGEADVKFKNAEVNYEKEVAIVKAKKQNQMNLLAFVSTIGIASFVVYFYLQKKKHHQIKEIQKERLQAVIDGEEKERTRIAKDLHDGIVQDLTAIKIQLNAAIQTNGNITKSIIDDATLSIDKASKEVRNISYQMMPATLRELGFIPAIDDLLKRVLTASEIQFDFEQIGITERLPEKIEVSIFRIIQELLNNVLKHSGANFVSLLITQKEKMITMIFEDNGKGFDELTIKRGIGLNSLSSRVELLHGNINYENIKGAGTVAIVRVPIDKL